MITALHHRPVGVTLLLLAALLLVGPAWAQTLGATPKDPETVAQVRKWNAECLECHVESALRRPPREGMDLVKLSQALTDPEAYAKSNHAGMACKTCHLGAYREYPHAGAVKEKAKTLECNECHAQQTWRVDEQVAKSTHAKKLKDKFTCNTCHNAHVYAKAEILKDSVKIVTQDNGMCMECHDSDKKFSEFGGVLIPGKKRPDIDVIHKWLPNTKRHWQAVRCIECHTPMATTRTLAMSHEILNKEKAQKDCVVCHTKNTALRTSLYRWTAEEETSKLGFLNSAIMGESYVIGATRNVYLDLFGLGLVGLTFAGVVGHGIIRILVGRKRRDK
jgi:predicted CXXCH cytochrome family protein